MSPKILVNAGYLLENLVFVALRRQTDQIYDYRTHRGHEVDFIAPLIPPVSARLLSSLAVAVALVGCGGDGGGATPDAALDTSPEDTPTDPVDDTASDVPPDTSSADATDDVDTDTPDAAPVCEPSWEVIARTPTSAVSDDGQDPATPPAVGQATGGRVRPGQRFFEGPYADCRVGDYVLTNAHVRVCIADERPASHYFFTGGHVIDMEPVDEPGSDGLIALMPSSNIAQATGDEVELVADGSDGGSAVVRVRGVDVMLRVVANLLGQVFPPQDLIFETEYRLAPDAQALEVVTWLRSAHDRRIGASLSELVLGGDHTLRYWQGQPLDNPNNAVVDLHALTSPGRSYGVYAPAMENHPITIDRLRLPLTSLELASGRLCPGEEAAVRRYYVVGDGDTPSLHAALSEVATFDDVTQGFQVTGTSPVARPRFAMTDAEGNAVAILALDATEVREVLVPAGTYLIEALDWSADPYEVVLPSDDIVTLAAPPLGRLVIEVTEDDAPLSAAVRVTGPVRQRLFAIGGVVETTLPPGDYQLEVVRGERYSFALEAATIVDGETVTVRTSLTETMDTSGWASGDMHQHSTPSLDSTVSLVDRAAANITAGLSFLAPSDHDGLGDFAGALEALGATDEIVLFQGIETSPIYGHFNMFPFAYDRELPSHGAPPLAIRTDDGLGREVASVPFLTLVQQDLDAGARILQMNHPRGGQWALFDYAHYDPVTGPDEVIASNWYDDFDSVEVMNALSETCIVMRDWFGLLSRGYRVAGVGNSDTHTLNAPSGYPRNYLHIGDAPLDADSIVEAIEGQRVSVSGGLFIDFVDALPGDVIAVDAGETATLHARVQSPAWAGADELVVFVNGVETDRIAIDTAREALVDFDDVLSFDLTRDSYVVLFAWSSERGNRDTRTTPVGFTNPVYFDVGGDGWSPPGVADAAELPELTGFPFCE